MLIVLCVEYQMLLFGIDGIQCDVCFVECVYCQGDCVWIVCELLFVLVYVEYDYVNVYVGYKYVDIDIVLCWIECDVKGVLSVCVVSEFQQKNYVVELVEYFNIGFDGLWVMVYYLFDLVVFKGMCVEGFVCNGVQIYCLMQGECIVIVDWDVVG